MSSVTNAPPAPAGEVAGDIPAGKAYRIGVIISSIRPNRISPRVVQFIVDTVQTLSPTLQNKDSNISFDIIDLAEYNLPFYNEPSMPAQVPDPKNYAHEYTRKWSARISALDAVIFQTSQRNWGVPAELKNAIDYLFHEWRGKPALIVTMGGTGGNQAREHLTTSLTGIGMKMVPEGVSLKFPSREFVMDYSFGGEKQLELDGTRSDGLWSAEREVLAAKFEELVALLKEP